MNYNDVDSHIFNDGMTYNEWRDIEDMQIKENLEQMHLRQLEDIVESDSWKSS